MKMTSHSNIIIMLFAFIALNEAMSILPYPEIETDYGSSNHYYEQTEHQQPSNFGELSRNTREVKITINGREVIPQPPKALCFREPCNVPGGFRNPSFNSGNYRFRRESEGSEGFLPGKRFRRAAANIDDKGFGKFSEQSNTRGTIHSQKSFGPNSHGGIHTSATLEHDLWKSNNGNGRVTAFGQYERVDGGRFNGFNDKKAGIKYSLGF